MRETETERLCLRYLTMQDAQQMYDHWAKDPEVTKFLTWTPHKNVQETERILHLWMQEYAKEPCYRWGIERKADHVLMGNIDVWDYSQGYPEIGYAIGKEYWNQGYMTEALQAVCRILKEDGYEKIVIRASAKNIASNRVIEKNGFQLTGTEEICTEKDPLRKTMNYYEL